MKVIYEVNGKRFDSMPEAEKYEKNLITKEKRQKELDDARDKYFKLLKQFNEDYIDEDVKEEEKVTCTPLTMPELFELIDELWSV